MVDSAKTAKASFISAKDTFVEKTPSPNEALEYLRGISKTYVAIIPGAGKYVDKTFDELDQLSRSHGTEFNEILSKATTEVREAIKVRLFLCIANPSAPFRVLPIFFIR